MIRFLTLAIVGLLVFLLVRASVRSFLTGLRGGGLPAGRRATSRDELVKDPVCETYIPRRKAIARGSGENTRYFCSASCADRFVVRAS